MTVDADGLPAPRLSVAPRMGMITAPYKRELSDLFGDMANILTIAKDQSGTRDVIGKMDEIRRDSPFRPFFAPPGKYRCDNPLPMIRGAPLSIYGAGSNGHGPADFDYQKSVLFLLEYASGDTFSAQTNFPCTFKGFRIETDVQFRQGYAGSGTPVVNTGCAIKIAGDTGTNAGSRVEDVGFVSKDVGIRLHKTVLSDVTLCAFLGWGTAAVWHSTDPSDEGSGGNIHINQFFGHPLANGVIPGPCIFSQTGYVWIYCNNMTGGTYGVYLAIQNRPAGAPRIFRNTIEDFYIAGVIASTVDGSPCSMLAIDDNEFSVVDPRPNLLASIYLNEYTKPWLFDWSVCRNIIRNNQNAQNAAPMIAIRGGVGGKANDNQLVTLGPNPQAGMVVAGANSNAALGGPIEALHNQYIREGAGAADFSYRLASVPGLVVVDDRQPMTLAQMLAAYPNLPAFGSSTLISDGTPGSSPLTGGGEGTRALVANGRWVGR